jgi:hypothetical protein
VLLLPLQYLLGYHCVPGHGRQETLGRQHHRPMGRLQ